jgi:threonine synthase
LHNRCKCGGTLLARYDTEDISLEAMRARPPGMWRYRELLPVTGDPVTLGEGASPLLFAPRISERLGVETYVKDDSSLPGSTFKARGAAIGVSRAKELGATSLVMPTAGNAGGAWSLYAARAGLPLTVVMAKSAPAANKFEVTTAGAHLVEVEGSITDAATEARRISSDDGAFLVATFAEPYRVEGKKTAFFEAFDAFGDEDSMRLFATVVTPVGGGLAAVAAHKAAAEVLDAGVALGSPPHIVGVQSTGCAPIARAFGAGASSAEPWGEPDTISAGLRVPNPSEADLVLSVVRSSRGSVVAVSDEDTLGGMRELASSEGIFACPEGAAAVAGAMALADEGRLEGPVLLFNTGAGSKYAADLSAYSSA